MLAVVMLSIALLVLVISGVILAFSHKERPQESSKDNIVEFETKYDEIKYLYENGKISAEDYQKQMKYIIN